MDWASERYVRLYVRDTPDWVLLPWQSRALWPLLLRKMDRHGRVELGAHEERGLAALVGLPLDVTTAGLKGLLVDGCVAQDGTALQARNYVPAQETRSSDAVRKQQQRDREQARAGHPPSPGVTNGHSMLSGAVPSGASRIDLGGGVPGEGGRPPRPPRSKSSPRARGTNPRAFKPPPGGIPHPEPDPPKTRCGLCGYDVRAREDGTPDEHLCLDAETA
jgi:hypothetical protein